MLLLHFSPLPVPARTSLAQSGWGTSCHDISSNNYINKKQAKTTSPLANWFFFRINLQPPRISNTALWQQTTFATHGVKPILGIHACLCVMVFRWSLLAFGKRRLVGSKPTCFFWRHLACLSMYGWRSGTWAATETSVSSFHELVVLIGHTAARTEGHEWQFASPHMIWSKPRCGTKHSELCWCSSLLLPGNLGPRGVSKMDWKIPL